MGKSKKNCCTPCVPCEPRKKYVPDCCIPLSSTQCCDPMYIGLCDGSVYCQETTVPDNNTRILDTRFNVDIVVSVNQGIPTGVFDNGNCTPLSNFPVPYYLQELSGNTRCDDVLLVNNVLNCKCDQTDIAKPVLGEDTSIAVVGDLGNRFALNPIPMFFVTASTGDTDCTYSMFRIKRPVLCMDLRITTQAATIAGLTETVTKVVCVEDITSPCRVPLQFTTFRVLPLESFDDNIDSHQVNPVFWTLVKNTCCKYSVALVHGVAVDTTAGLRYPRDDECCCSDDSVEVEWPCYTLVAGKGKGCSVKEPSCLVKLFDCVLFNGIYAISSVLSESTVATLDLISVATSLPVTPGDLTASQRNTMIKEASLSLVQMWATAIDAFNVYIKTEINGET